MLRMKRPRLSAVRVWSDFCLELTFIDDQRWVVDLSQDLQDAPGLQPLLDPEIFASVILGDHGWSVEWPEPDIQIGADTLYLEMLAQRSSPHPASAAHTAH